MIEWIIFGIAIISFAGFNVWIYFVLDYRLKAFEDYLHIFLSKFDKDLRSILSQDLERLRANDEEIIIGLKEILTAIEQVDNVILDVVNNLTLKDEKKTKKGKK